MDLKQHYKLRVQNCVGTILDLHKAIFTAGEAAGFRSQFRALEQAIQEMDMSLVTEGDILLVEKATNALFKELTPIFKSGNLEVLCAGMKS
jgi:hypothetical protein